MLDLYKDREFLNHAFVGLTNPGGLGAVELKNGRLKYIHLKLFDKIKYLVMRMKLWKNLTSILKKTFYKLEYI